VEVYLHLFFDLGIIWRWVVSFTPGKEPPDTHWIGGWVGSRCCLRKVIQLCSSVWRAKGVELTYCAIPEVTFEVTPTGQGVTLPACHEYGSTHEHLAVLNFFCFIENEKWSQRSGGLSSNTRQKETNEWLLVVMWDLWFSSEDVATRFLWAGNKIQRTGCHGDPLW